MPNVFYFFDTLYEQEYSDLDIEKVKYIFESRLIIALEQAFLINIVSMNKDEKTGKGIKLYVFHPGLGIEQSWDNSIFKFESKSLKEPHLFITKPSPLNHYMHDYFTLKIQELSEIEGEIKHSLLKDIEAELIRREMSPEMVTMQIQMLNRMNEVQIQDFCKDQNIYAIQTEKSESIDNESQTGIEDTICNVEQESEKISEENENTEQSNDKNISELTEIARPYLVRTQFYRDYINILIYIFTKSTVSFNEIKKQLDNSVQSRTSYFLHQLSNKSLIKCTNEGKYSLNRTTFKKIF